MFINGSKRLLHGPCYCHSPRAANTPRRCFARVPHRQMCSVAKVRVVGFGSLFRLSALRHGRYSTLRTTSGVLFVPSTLDCVLANGVMARCAVTSASRVLGPHAGHFRGRLLSMTSVGRRRFNHFIFPKRPVKMLARRIRGVANLKTVPIVTITNRSANSTITTMPTRGREFTCLDSNA